MKDYRGERWVVCEAPKIHYGPVNERWKQIVCSIKRYVILKAVLKLMEWPFVSTHAMQKSFLHYITLLHFGSYLNIIKDDM